MIDGLEQMLQIEAQPAPASLNTNLSAAVCARGLVKRFGSRLAIDNLDFTVPQGQIFGFLGANGAGKTTAFRMILDIIRPTSGSIFVFGRSPGRDNAARIGFLPEERGLYSKMSAEETVRYFGELKGMSSSDARQRAKKLLEQFGLRREGSCAIEQLSKGMAQKVQLAAALVNEPSLLILDEPFSGLDPVNQELLEAEIRASARRGASVIFSTHVMQHAERLCDRLLLLVKGKKSFEGSLDDATTLLAPRLLMVARQDPRRLPAVKSANLEEKLGDGWSEWLVELDHREDPAALLEWCTVHQIPLRRFEQLRPSLHDVFLHLTRGACDGPANIDLDDAARSAQSEIRSEKAGRASNDLELIR